MDRPADWDRIADLAKTMGFAPDQTIRPPDRSGVLSVEGRAVRALSALGGEGGSVRFELIGTLGEGGMGVVRLGRQIALDREVAVKELTDGRKGDDTSVLKLLQEAWVAGSLEHPNIVPVYDIEMQAGGEPRIVMKRIQGSPWSELIADPEAVEARFGESDLLGWNLQVLEQVANAVRYAHNRGIVHLDLKPANVMLGEFGEVYLVDWGLGMALNDSQDGRFPLAAHNTEIIGTPAYLAPEMLAGDGSQLSERTDVYLLGSVLYEVITGHPPHRGPNVMALLFSAATGTVELPDDVPEELAAVCLRAMAKDPGDRFSSADAFRAAVRDFEQHRGSIRLSDEAGRQLAVLQDLAAAGLGEDVRAHWDAVHRSFTEARFGFRQALAAWPGNVAAADGLRRSVLTMAEHTLEHGTAQAAATVLSELDDPPDDLRERVAEGLRRAQDEVHRIAKLERIGDDMNLAIGRRTRLFVMGVLGLLWTIYPLFVRFFTDGHMGLYDLFVAPAIFLAVVAGLGWFARESMGKTLVNRRMFAVCVVLFVAQVVLVGFNVAHGVSRAVHAGHLFLLWTLVAVFSTLLVEWKLWPTALAQSLGFAAVAVSPENSTWAIAGANLTFVINILIVWWPGTIRGTYDGDTRVR